MKTTVKLVLTLVLLSTLNSQLSTLLAQGTAFTYQGRLNSAGAPANGFYDLTFALFDSPSAGTQQGTTVTNTATPVSNGLFTVTIDFGNQFPGTARWLEISAQTNGGAGFATLSPRTPLTSAPYAVRSQSAAAAATATTATTVTGGVSASQLTGTIAPANIAAGSISSTMLATGSVTSAQIASSSISVDKLATVTEAPLQVTITELAYSTNYGYIHQFGQTMSTAGSSKFVVSDPNWDSYQCGCIFCICYTVNASDQGILWMYNNDGSFVAGYTAPSYINGQQFGAAVADLGGNQMLVGAPGAGLVYSMNYSGGVSSQTRGGPASDGFGKSVAGLPNGLQLIGAPQHSSVYGVGDVLVYNGSSLSSGGVIYPPPPAQNGQFGSGMAVVGPNRLLISAPTAFSIGCAYLYDVTLATMASGGTLVTSFTNPVSGAGFGYAMVALGTDRVLIGAPGNPGGGAAYLYSTNGTLLVTFTAPDGVTGDGFGAAISTFGPDKVLISSPSKTINGVSQAGVVYVFNTNGTWVGIARNPTPQPNAEFGTALLTLDTNHLVASAFDLPNQASLGSARIFSFDGPKYLPGLAPAGNGAFVTNLNASALASGTVADARLSSNVALRAGGNNFTGNQIITAGNIGIGTPSPAAKLNVVSDGAAVQINAATAGESSYLSFFDSAQAVEGLIGVDGTGFSGTPNQFSIAAWSSNPIGFFTAAAQRMTISPNGNVGIGTTTPNYPLSFASALGEKIALWDDGNGQNYGMGITNFGLQIHADTALADIIFGYGSSSNLTETMRIKGSGSVGIGTGFPGKLLQLGSGTNQTDAIIRLGCGNTGAGRTWDLGVPYGGNNTGGTNYSFVITDTGVNVARFMIDWNTGDVCIGTTTPLGMLTVSNAYCNGTAWVNASDRSLKQDFASVDPKSILHQVLTLPIESWTYKAQPGDKHIGPVAQDFHAAFGLNGTDDKHIATVDESGVALAAIQGLNQKLEGEKQDTETQLKRLEAQNAQLQRELNELKQLVKAMNR